MDTDPKLISNDNDISLDRKPFFLPNFSIIFLLHHPCLVFYLLSITYLL